MPALQAAPRSISVRFGDELLQSGFTAVPNLVLSNYAALGMSSAEMLFTIQIWYHWWSKHDPHPSLKTIAGRMGVSRRQARTYAQSLRRKKLLIVRERYSENSGQTTSEYDFTPLLEEVRRHAGGVQEPQRPPRKDSSEGGRKNPSGTPRNNPSPEEDPQKEEEPSQKRQFEFSKGKDQGSR